MSSRGEGRSLVPLDLARDLPTSAEDVAALRQAADRVARAWSWGDLAPAPPGADLRAPSTAQGWAQFELPVGLRRPMPVRRQEH